jgi:hypothetical protein
MPPKLEIEADEAVQDVLNAWGAIITGPKPHAMTAEFSTLFAKMQAYRMAKRSDETHRHYNLTKEHAAQEPRTKNEFLDAYHAFYTKHRQSWSHT